MLFAVRIQLSRITPEGRGWLAGMGRTLHHSYGESPGLFRWTELTPYQVNRANLTFDAKSVSITFDKSLNPLLLRFTNSNTR